MSASAGPGSATDCSAASVALLAETSRHEVPLTIVAKRRLPVRAIASCRGDPLSAMVPAVPVDVSATIRVPFRAPTKARVDEATIASGAPATEIRLTIVFDATDTTVTESAPGLVTNTASPVAAT